MRPAVFDLAAGALPGGRGQGVQLFKEFLDLCFRAAPRRHLLPASVMFGVLTAMDTTKGGVKVQVPDTSACVSRVHAGYLS